MLPKSFKNHPIWSHCWKRPSLMAPTKCPKSKEVPFELVKNVDRCFCDVRVDAVIVSRKDDPKNSFWKYLSLVQFCRLRWNLRFQNQYNIDVCGPSWAGIHKTAYRVEWYWKIKCYTFYMLCQIVVKTPIPKSYVSMLHFHLSQGLRKVRLLP